MSEHHSNDDQHRISRRMVIAAAAALAVPIAGYGDAVSQDSRRWRACPTNVNLALTAHGWL